MQLDIETGFAEKEDEWAEGFDVVEKNRARRGVRLKYSLEYLHRLRALFPGYIRMLVLRHLSSIVAAALVYRVLPGVHYVAAWGDAGHDLAYSPMNYLAHQVVVDALKQGAHVVDLGLSSIDGVANEGLVQFKRNVGSTTGMRLDMVRDL
jgi:hypothetical protein